MIFFLLAWLAGYLLAKSTRRWGAYALAPVAAVLVTLGTIMLLSIFGSTTDTPEGQKRLLGQALGQGCFSPFVICVFIWLHRFSGRWDEGQATDEEALVKSLLVHRQASYWSVGLITLSFLGWSGIGLPDVSTETTDATQLFKKAEAGDLEARFTLAESYGGRENFGLRRDATLAADWYRKAAEKGHREAQFKLGECYFHGQGVSQNHEEAVRWYLKSSQADLAEAQTMLGYCYLNGKGVAINVEEARLWLTKAAAQGDNSAVSLLKELQNKSPSK